MWTKVLAACVLVFMLISCSSQSGNEVEEPAPIAEIDDSANPIIQIKTGGLEKRILFEETIPQDNCNGSAEISSSIQHSSTIIYTLEADGTVTVDANGEVGIPAVGKVGAGAAVAAHYGVNYGSQETVSRTLEVAAKEGTNITHTIQQIEYWETGEVTVKAGEESFTFSFKFPRSFDIQVVETTNLGCPDEKIQETVSPTRMPENTSTPSPTQEPIPTQTETPSSNNIPNTQPGTVLNIGQTWTTDGLSVQLERVDLSNFGDATIFFNFYNETGRTLFFSFNENLNVTMQDDKGNFHPWAHTYKQDVALEDGNTYREGVHKKGPFTGAEYLIITLDLPGLIHAQWRYN